MAIVNQNTEEFGFIKHKFGKTFYRFIHSSNSKKKKAPLICLHGGPGSTHWSIYNMIGFSKSRDVIIYDQIGCGFSDPLAKKNRNVNTFVIELHQLIKDLKLKDFHVLGHSWGTMLAMDFYLRHPKGIKSIVFSSPCLSASMWQSDADILVSKLPKKIQQTILKHQLNKTTQQAEYQKAMVHYYNKFVLGNLKPSPHRKIVSHLRSQDVYHSMWGPSEFCATGSLRNYEKAEFIENIKVPSLFTCGRFDEATPKTTKYFASLAKKSRFHEFKKSAHVPHATEAKEYIRIIDTFLNSSDK